MQVACIKYPYAAQFQLSGSKKKFKEKIRIGQGRQRERKTEGRGRGNGRKSGKEERGKTAAHKKSSFPYKTTWSKTTDLAIRLFDAESRTGIPQDVCASSTRRSTLESAVIPTYEPLPKPTGHTETQHSSLSLEDCSPQPCSLILDHFNHLILNTRT